MTIVYIFAGLLLLSVLIAWYSYRTAFYSPEKRKEDYYAIPKGEQYEKERQRMLSLIREMDEIPFEAVTISAQDGTKLSARYYHVRDGAPLQSQFHGYRGTALRDFCGGNKLARESGQNTLVVDQRAHGKSGGTTITFGIRERLDCLCWAEYANQRFGSDTPVFLSGVSMGAATVLMASELELPTNVVGIIADCPYSSPEAIIRKVCREDMHLLLHGEDDRFVPCNMSREIFDACIGEKTRITFPSAGHGLSYIEDTETYSEAVSRFVDQCLQNNRRYVKQSLEVRNADF